MSFVELLAQVPASTIGSSEIVSVSKETNVAQVLDILREKHFQAIPIQDSTNATGFFGFCDVLDLVASLVSSCKDINSNSFQHFISQTVADVSNKSHKDEFISLSPDATLLDVLHKFATGVHRVALSPEGGAISLVISQFDLIRFASENFDKIAVASTTIKEAKLAKEWVLTSRKNERTLSAFKKMNENSVSAIAIVDEEDKFVANFSASLITTLNPDSLSRIRLPVADFVHSLHENNEDFACKATDTIQSVIVRVLSHQLHRVWVLDDRNHPIGVVTLTDLCALLLK